MKSDVIATSYFAKTKQLLSSGKYVLFSIAGKTPDWFEKLDGCFNYKLFAPKYYWWKEWKEKFFPALDSEESQSFYIEKYKNTVLNNLNQDAIARQLKELSFKKTPCLLCYEAAGKFCHRHIVADWFRKAGIICDEVKDFS